MDIYLGNREFYIYDASWETGGSGFSWNEGTTTDLTTSTAGKNPILDFVHRKEFSVGLRGSFLNKILSAEVTFFKNDMDGYINQNPTNFPSHLQTGYNGGTFKPAINNHCYSRKGLDFSVTAQKQLGQVHATLGVVGTYLKTRIKKYDQVVDEEYQRYEGMPLDAITGYECLGFYTNDDFDISETADGKTKYVLKAGIPRSTLGGNIQPGDLKYKDLNGDNVINTKDYHYLGKSGSMGAPLTLGLNLTLKYKNFTFFLVGNGEFGAQAMKNGTYYNMQGDYKYSINVYGRWTPETAATATHPRLTTFNSYNNSVSSTFWMINTDRFNIRKIQLTYDFPEEMWKGKIVKALSIYLNGNDLFTISKEHQFLDLNVGYAPQTRFYNLGVKVTL
jgi:hypothetical protein